MYILLVYLWKLKYFIYNFIIRWNYQIGTQIAYCFQFSYCRTCLSVCLHVTSKQIFSEQPRSIADRIIIYQQVDRCGLGGQLMRFDYRRSWDRFPGQVNVYLVFSLEYMVTGEILERSYK